MVCNTSRRDLREGVSFVLMTISSDVRFVRAVERDRICDISISSSALSFAKSSEANEAEEGLEGSLIDLTQLP